MRLNFCNDKGAYGVPRKRRGSGIPKERFPEKKLNKEKRKEYAVP
jgi:hypothetical protein